MAHAHTYAPARPDGPDVPDLLRIDVTPGTKVFLTSDLHFPGTPSEASLWAQDQVSKALSAIEGPAVLILAGDIIELWAGEQPSTSESMAAHPEWAAAVRDFGRGEGRRVVCLPGNHDGRLGWDSESVEVVHDDLGAELAFAVNVVLATPQGPERPARAGGAVPQTIHVEHGHRWDPANRFEDPRDPLDTPLGQHVVQQILPDLTRNTSQESILHGVEALSDPRTFPAFVSSRVFYHRMLKEMKWLLLPFVIAIGIHFGIFFLDSPADLHLTARDFVVFNISLILVVATAALVLVLAGRRTWRTASTGMARKRGKTQNDNSRAAAGQMVGDRYAGFICGHTHHPELSALGSGFYANTGSGTRVVDQVDARWHFPHVFVTRLQLSWIVLDAGDDGWTAQLFAGHRPVGTLTRLERLVSGQQNREATDPQPVASYR